MDSTTTGIDETGAKLGQGTIDEKNANTTHQTEVISNDVVPNPYNDVCARQLELLYSSILFYVPKQPHKPYFLLVNPERKDKPLKLYRSAMLKLVENLNLAKAKVESIRADYPGDEILYEIAIINRRKESYVRLVVQTFGNEGYIYVRLFEKKEGRMEPTRYGIRIMPDDPMEKIKDFVSVCK